MNRKAFTLMEMLVVVILIGVILAIAIPSVSSILARRSNEMFNTHMTLVENITNAYELKHKGELVGDSCYEVDYETLKHNGLEESDIKCEGSIIIKRSGNGNSFINDYYLTCVDSKNKEQKSTSKSVPTNCIHFGS